MPALSFGSGDPGTVGADVAASAAQSQYGITQSEVNVQTLIELRVISHLLNYGLNMNEDLDALRNDFQNL